LAIPSDKVECRNTKKEFSNRKDQKRIEAKLRQNKYKATKDLIKSINVLESEISKLEKEYQELECKLADPEFYSKGEFVKQATANFNAIKFDLNTALNKWEELNENLQNIKSQLN
jgi:ATP-binding cassette subfamily F protein 3